MSIRSSEHKNNWFEGDDPQIAYLKKWVTASFERFEYDWKAEVPDWKYEIQERQTDSEYSIKVFAGRGSQFLLLKESGAIFPNSSEEEILKTKINVWENVLFEMTYRGAKSTYQDMSSFMRESHSISDTFNHSNFPLTIEECQPGKL